MAYRVLSELTNIEGMPVLLRLDLNAPVKDGKVADDYRIKKSLPVIELLRGRKAKTIIISHTEGNVDTLKPVFEYMKEIMEISFCEDCLKEGKGLADSMKPGDVVLCENIRMYEGEKNNDDEFAKQLASMAEAYVNDAFSVSHREHASIVGVPKFIPGYLGLQFAEEIQNLSVCFKPPHPFTLILGGAKFDTKMPLVERLLPIADVVVIAGALANDLFKARGLQTGVSRMADSKLDLSKIAFDPKIVLPEDVVVETPDGKRYIKAVAEINPEETIYDAGPQSVKRFKTIIAQSSTVLWNGPLGFYEKGFKEPTLKIAEAISESSAKSFIGGGDTLAAIAELGLEDKFTFVSTGGGAMLDFLAKGTLPGLEALKS